VKQWKEVEACEIKLAILLDECLGYVRKIYFIVDLILIILKQSMEVEMFWTKVHNVTIYDILNLIFVNLIGLKKAITTPSKKEKNPPFY
jgi:hypothetical protein